MILQEINGRGVLRYKPKDRVVVCRNGVQSAGYVVRLADFEGDQPCYDVRIDGERKEITVNHQAIVQQAYHAEFGQCEYVERF